MAKVPPTLAEFKALFPAFSAVPDATVEAYIVRGNRMVDDTWTEGDYTHAIALLAAHLLTLAGLGTGTDAAMAANGLGGFKVIKSGQLMLERGGAGAGDGGAVPDEWAGSAYGQQFYWLLKRNRPAVAVAGGTNAVPAGGWYPSLPWLVRW